MGEFWYRYLRSRPLYQGQSSPLYLMDKTQKTLELKYTKLIILTWRWRTWFFAVWNIWTTDSQPFMRPKGSELGALCPSQFNTVQPLTGYLRSINILCSHLYSCLLRGVFPSDLPTILYERFVCNHAWCPTISPTSSDIKMFPGNPQYRRGTGPNTRPRSQKPSNEYRFKKYEKQ